MGGGVLARERLAGIGDRLLRAWGFACALFLGVNLLAIPVREARLLDNEPELEPHVDAGIRASYPELSEPERRRLVWESFSRFELEALAQQRERPRSGDFVNVSDHGYRLVAEQGSWPPTAAHYNVFFFGGSTGFGYGVRDEDTVASRLQDLLGQRDGRPVRVYNFAHGGFNSLQERLALDRLIALDHVPDLAVFLDGMNDFQAGPQALLLTRAATRTLDKTLRSPMRTFFEGLPVVRALPPRLLGRKPAFERQRHAEAETPERERRRFDDAKRHRGVIARYLANLSVVRRIAASRSFDVLFVWQPIPNHHYDLAHHVFQGHFGSHSHARYGYPRMAQRVIRGGIDDAFVWCADVQLGLAEPLYVDSVHYNPKLSRIVARCIRDAIADGERPLPVVGPGRG